MRTLKYAFRTLFKTPFVTAVALLSLALGIGANAAIFSLFDQMLLRPLPVEQPRQLVNLSSPGPKPGSQSSGTAGGTEYVFSYPMFRDLEAQQTSFTGIAAHRSFGANLAYKGQTAGGEGLLVSSSYFAVLDLQPALGRLLSKEDDKTIGESHVVVLSYEYWRTRFGARPEVVNDTMSINGKSMTIVGVAPEGFNGTTLGNRPKVYVPISMRHQLEANFDGFDNRRSYWIYLFARLKPGVTVDRANAAINGPYHTLINDVEAPLQKGMSDATMAKFRAKTLMLEDGARGQSTVHAEAQIPLIILMSVTGVVLLIACANIANLLLARATGRSTEMAVRLSIGANRGQLVRQLLTESCVLALMGGVAGMLVAHWTLAAIQTMLPSDGAESLPFEMNASVLVFGLIVSLATGVLFGLFPAIYSTRPDLATTLKAQSGQPGGGRAAKWFRTSLATTQVMLSMALLVMAGLFTKSLINVSRVDLGLQVDHLVTFGLAPSLNGYSSDQSRALLQRTEDAIAAQPGVSGVTAALVPMLAGDNWGNSLTVQGYPTGPDVDTYSSFNAVGPGFFRTTGQILRSGREFTASDVVGAPKVAVVNEAFAKKFKLGNDAVGKFIAQSTGNGAKLDIEIVGVVQNAKYSEVKNVVPPVYYLPYRQDPQVGSATFYVRTPRDPGEVLRAIPGVIRQLDPNLPVAELRTMEQQVRENVFLDRMISTLSASFATLATLLAAIGLYGVLAYTVTQRTREFGLRMALGADPGRVRRLVLRQVLWMTIVGGSIGVALAVLGGIGAKALLFELEGYDPVVLTVSVVSLSIVSMLAGLIPAVRASRIDPMKALRYE